MSWASKVLFLRHLHHYLTTVLIINRREVEDYKKKYRNTFLYGFEFENDETERVKYKIDNSEKIVIYWLWRPELFLEV